MFFGWRSQSKAELRGRKLRIERLTLLLVSSRATSSSAPAAASSSRPPTSSSSSAAAGTSAPAHDGAVNVRGFAAVAAGIVGVAVAALV